MDFDKYKLKIFFPLTIAILIAASISVYVNYYLQQSTILQNKQDVAPVFLKSFHSKTVESADIFSTYLDMLNDNEQIQHFFLEKNRRKLNEIIHPFYINLHDKIDVTHLYFIDTEGRVILRAHDPQRHSDTIKRYTFEQAQKSGRLSYGLEFGTNMHYTLRVVKPWIVDGRIIGYLEMGKEVDKYMHSLASDLDLEVYLAVEKQLFENASASIQERLAQKVQTKTHYIAYQTADMEMDFQKLIDNRNLKKIKVADNHYAVYINPMVDASGDLLGQMLFLMDMTSEYHAMWNSTMVYALIILVIVLFVLGAAKFFVNQEEAQIANLTDKVALKTSLLEEANQRLEKYLNQNQELLSQYKSAVDTSSIVSKTDLKGHITYVNDSFCKISGFSRKELIGKPHNIVRHPDMPSEAFAEMWQTIRNKRPWQGVVKNRKKDGGYYIVETTVMPILDENGNIQEFISIRFDITEMVDLKNEIIETQKEIIYTLGELGESRSKETSNHVKRVAEYSKVLAIGYGLSEAEANLIRSASPMHDIGKIAIPDRILLKRGELEANEFLEMKMHAEYGYSIFKNSSRDILKAAAIIAYHHHEKWDGTGYPQGLKGDEIHIYGRITALADVFDALASERVYKQAWPIDKVLDFIQEQRGKQFDPELVDVFFRNLHELLRIHGDYP